MHIYILYIDIWIQYGELELANLDCIESLDSQPAVTCSKLTLETQEKGNNKGTRTMVPLLSYF